MKYCSAACRRGLGDADNRLEAAILSLLGERTRARRDATICPSEAARLVFGESQWRPHMEDARRAARRLVAAGRLLITQQGRPVDPSHAKGPIRLRLP